MISLNALFWLLIGLLALIGALRGWTKEVITTSGLILSLFALNQFGFFLINLLGVTVDPAAPDAADALRRRQFYVLAAVHLLITFFSYQGPTIAGPRVTERLRVRDSFQDKVMGALVGAVNGYLLFGALWAFLEYEVGPNGFTQQLAEGVRYPFEMTTLVRPGLNGIPPSPLIDNLPLPFLAPYLPILVVLVFLFVIVVMI
jgi:uncharacterized membrane protein required for colicin V production